MEHIKLKVEGMSCNHCKTAIEHALKELGAKGEVDLDNKSVSVNYDQEKANVSLIKKQIEELGYDVVVR